jgi:hypothetical protein
MQHEITHRHGRSPLQRAISCHAIMCNSLGSVHFISQLVDSKKRRRHSWHGNSKSNLVGRKFSDDRESSTTEDSSSVFRKARVAIVGGTMVGVGLVMIPLPTPGGWIVATAGMMHLGQEFPAAQRILNTTKEKVLGAFQKKPTTPVTPTRDEKDPSQEPFNSPTNVKAIWEFDREDEATIFETRSDFSDQDDVFVKVWHA